MIEGLGAFVALFPDVETLGLDVGELGGGKSHSRPPPLPGGFQKEGWVL